ncbi:MAG: radical SAM family heme chaperone HemW [Eubacterium sp.]|nr:radical SAM family heme chaperone HemW [Eubacterium sp.]MBR6171809.1 radical SAM family heme chaperone HemW [Eubacterium sp.]
MKRNLSLYIHIPFCVHKCIYCDFLSFDDSMYATQLQYMDALRTELGLYRPYADRYVVRTIFIGGGTPSIVDESLIEALLSTVRQIFSVDRFAEITIEANPGTLKYTDLLAYQSYGINRLSIGLQSADDEMLRMLGRIHNFDQFVAGFTSARRAGFRNINVDVMTGIPGQDMHSCVDTLTRVMEYRPEHISAYSLQVEEGTPLSQDPVLMDMLPDEEADRRMYAMTKKILRTNGYERYEFSNYCQPGCECRHNVVYWTGGEYIGIGLGAASLFKGERFSNLRELDAYLELMKEVSELEAKEHDKLQLYEAVAPHLHRDPMAMYVDRRMEEFMFLGLRMMRGVSRKEFQERFHKDMFSVYGSVINHYVDDGFMVLDEDRVRLSDAGIDVSNLILSDFLLNS